MLFGILHLLRWLRHLPDRLLHPLRRKAALRRVAGRTPETVLFVCHGNVCRSPFAEALVRQRRPELRVVSAGFIAPGRAAPPEGLQAARAWNLDLGAHRSRPLRAELVRSAGAIVVMDDVQRSAIRYLYGVPRSRIELLGDFDPAPITRRAIPDPVEQPLQAFTECYARIERCVTALLAQWPPRGAGR